MFISRRKKNAFIGRNWWVKPLFRLFFVLGAFFCLLYIGKQPLLVSRMLNLISGQADSASLIAEVIPINYDTAARSSWDDILHGLVLKTTGVNVRNPVSLLDSELNLMVSQAAAGAIASAPVEEEGGEEDFFLPDNSETQPEEEETPIPMEFPPVQLNGAPMILIYSTHNSESYQPSDGVSKQDGKNGGVAVVAKTLSQAMESRNSIKTIYSSVIHDYPDWTKSYINSAETAKKLLQQNPKIQLVLDIHRDAGMDERSDTLVKIGKKNCATVMIVVGTEHPRWRENLAFAQKLEAKAKELYPGLVKPIRIRKDRRYNQNLHPRALLFEVGSNLNTREDAQNSAVLMADVIAAVLKNK